MLSCEGRCCCLKVLKLLCSSLLLLLFTGHLLQRGLDLLFCEISKQQAAQFFSGRKKKKKKKKEKEVLTSDTQDVLGLWCCKVYFTINSVS